MLNVGEQVLDNEYCLNTRVGAYHNIPPLSIKYKIEPGHC